MKKIIWIVLALVVLLAFCGKNSDEPDDDVPACIATASPTMPAESPEPTPTPEPTAEPTPTPVPTPTAEPMVWIPQSGERYHRKASCSDMENPTQVTKSDAIAWGYTACGRCY